jgi:hypothetical protein
MAYWDTSGLLKLYLDEPDSPDFVAMAANDSVWTLFLARYEMRAALLRREGEGALRGGGADQVYQQLISDITNGNVTEMPLTPALEAVYAEVLRQCLLCTQPVFIRTNDAMHLASARLAGEREVVSADSRQRTAAAWLGFTVRPS